MDRVPQTASRRRANAEKFAIIKAQNKLLKEQEREAQEAVGGAGAAAAVRPAGRKVAKPAPAEPEPVPVARAARLSDFEPVPVARAARRSAEVVALAPAPVPRRSEVKPSPVVRARVPPAAASPFHVSVIDRLRPYVESARPYLAAGYGHLRSMFSRAVSGAVVPAPVVTAPLMPTFRRLVGSIATERDNNSDYMKNIGTWPASRQYLLSAIHEKLEPLLERYHRVLPSLESVFAKATRMGEKSAYGIVYNACVASDADARAPVCWQLPEARGKALTLVVKLIEKPRKEMVPRYAGYCNRRKAWVGNENPYREILMGRLLNRLVRRNITPHFPMIYESFEVADKDMVGFAMETCNIDFVRFLGKVMRSVRDDESRIKLFTIAVLQLTHALISGQKHFDFRHNDFHAENAMATLIVNSAYVYKFGADDVDAEETLYEIPNAGMCWKLIDFGYSSSDIFCAEDNKTQLKTSRALSGLRPEVEVNDDGTTSISLPYFIGDEYAVEMYDLLRFLNFTIDELSDYDAADAAASLAFFTGLCDDLLVISARSPKRGTLMGVHDIDERHLTADYTASSGLLRQFFKGLARRFKVQTPADKRRVLSTPEHIFDTDAHPFSRNEVLTGFEAGHFTVNADGELTAIRENLPARAGFRL